MSRADAMRARMADAEFRKRALANLEKGRAARASKRKGAPPPADLDPKPAAPPPAEPTSTQRRSVGMGRWRG